MTLHKAAPNNQLLVRCVPGQLLTQPSGLTNALLRMPLLETTPSQPPPLRFTPWERSKSRQQEALLPTADYSSPGKVGQPCRALRATSLAGDFDQRL
ncbi:MAG: hypothetical protein V3U39_11445, partial [Acidimicrobiia bacterium]